MEKELKQYIGNVDEFVTLAKEKIAALQSKCDRYEKALKDIVKNGENVRATYKTKNTPFYITIANEALNGEGEKPVMQFNSCKTCGAGNGRAGLLINDECLNCYETRERGAVTIHTNLERTQDEIDKTIGVLNQKEDKQ